MPQFALSVLSAAALSGCAASAPPPRASPPVTVVPPASTRPAAAPGQLPGVGNFARVAPGIYRGAQPTAEGFAELKKAGVRTVVNLRFLSSDRDLMRGTGLRYVHIPTLPWAPGDAAAVALLSVLRDPGNYPVFVHCQHGADRTGYLMAVYRVVEQGWAMEDAVREMQAFGPHAVWFPIAGYLRELRAARVRALVARSVAPKVDIIP